MILHQFLEWHARERPGGEFARMAGGGPERSITLAEARDETYRLAGAIRNAGLAPGDRFAYLSRNSVDFPIAYLAASASGTVIVPLNYRLALPEWAHVIEDSGARLLIARSDRIAAIDPIRTGHPAVRRWVALDGPVLPGWIDYRAWVAAAPARRPEPAGAIDDLCQMDTSGTTGRPKGAILTHANVTANASQIVVAIGDPARPGERIMVAMPVFHAGAASQIFCGIIYGSSFLIHEDFDPAAVVRSLSEEAVVTTSLVPAMIRACLDQVPDAACRRYPTLRAIFYGASPIDSETLRRALAVFPTSFFQAYGMTETSAVLTILSPADHARALAGEPELLLSAGRPIPGTEIVIVDQSERPVPPGVPGQILARGPQVMKGYWRRDVATAATLAGGWIRTGDIGRLDREGYLYLLDRLNDVIVSGGENIYPREVEEAIMGHDEIADAAVVGIPDDRLGEAVLAFVVPRAGCRPTAEDVIAHCRLRIAGYKVPRAVTLVETLPRNPTGKVLKRELREPYWVGRDRRIG